MRKGFLIIHKGDFLFELDAKSINIFFVVVEDFFSIFFYMNLK